VIALGRPWVVPARIEQATGVRRETAGRLPEVSRDRGAFAGELGEKSFSKPATLVTTGSGGPKPANKPKAATLVTTAFAGSDAARAGRPALGGCQ